MLVHHSMGRILELAHLKKKMHLDWRIDLPLRLNASFIRILPWVILGGWTTSIQRLPIFSTKKMLLDNIICKILPFYFSGQKNQQVDQLKKKLDGIGPVDNRSSTN